MNKLLKRLVRSGMIIFIVLMVMSAAAEDNPDKYEPHIYDGGGGGVHFQLLGSSDGGRVYNAGFWGWGHGGLVNVDLTSIRGAGMGDVYGVDAMTGIMIPYDVMPVAAIGYVAGYNIGRERLFLAVYPELSIRVSLGREAVLGLMGRYYISSEGTDENLLFFGAGLNLAIE
jgi:hypothetical protein